MFGDDWDDRFGETMRRSQHQHHQHQQNKGGFTPPWSANKDKSIILLRANGERMKFTLKYVDREYYDVAKVHFPHTEDEVHIPEHFATLTYGKPPFSPCVYTATTDYLQARWGRKLDDSDKDWLGSHPYAADGGVPREYMPTCVQQMLEPYGMGVSRINIRKGVLLIPESLFDWMRALGCNPFAMVDHQTSNAEAAEKLGVPLADANKMWRVEFSDKPLPCSITGEQNFTVPTGQTVKVGDKGGHARYLPPRGYFNDWFISCQLDALERIEYFVPTPNPEYVPRRGDPSLSLSSVRRPDGQPLAVQAKKGYSTYWVSPEEAQEIAEKLAAAPAVPAAAIPPIPVITAPPPKSQESVQPRNKDVIDVLKLPRVYMTSAAATVQCPVKGCRQKHAFPVGKTLRYVERHSDLMLYEWLCFTCRERFTTTYGHTSKKSYRQYLQTTFDTKTVTPPVQSGGAGLQRSFPGFCGSCAREMDPASIGDSGKCGECSAWDALNPKSPAAVPTVTPPVVAPAPGNPVAVPSAFHCWGCEETYDDATQELDNTGLCRECISVAFDGIICPEDTCKQDLGDPQYLPHFLGYDAETEAFDWCCVKCATPMFFKDNDTEASFVGVIAISRILSMPDSLDVKQQRELLDDWIVIRELLEEDARAADRDTPPDDEAMMPFKCPECLRQLGETTCEAVEKTPDGSMLFACTHQGVDGKQCGAVMYVRAPQEKPPESCPECKRSNDVVPPNELGVAYTEMKIHGYHLYVQVYNCGMCHKNYLDLRGSNTPPNEVEAVNAGN